MKVIFFQNLNECSPSAVSRRYVRIRNEMPTILNWWLTFLATVDRLFPTNSTLKFCNFADEIGRSNRHGGKGPGQKGATIALFHRCLSKIIILSAAVRISLIPWTGGWSGSGRNRPECRRKGWIAGVRCGVWSALLALSTVSTSTNRRFCRRTYHFSSVLLHNLDSLLSRHVSRSTPLDVYARDRLIVSPASLLFIIVAYTLIPLSPLSRLAFYLTDNSID